MSQSEHSFIVAVGDYYVENVRFTKSVRTLETSMIVTYTKLKSEAKVANLANASLMAKEVNGRLEEYETQRV